MRKLPAALVILGVAGALLTGCATPSFSTDACVRPASDASVAGFAAVTGELGKEPEVEIAAPVRVSETAFADVISGSGTRLQTDRQLARIELVLYSGTTGERLVATAFDPDTTALSSRELWAEQLPGLAYALDCAAAGTRTVVAMSTEDGGPIAQALGPNDSLIVVADVVTAQLTRAEGTRRFNDGRGLPSVVRATDGRPGVVIPDSAAPTELVTQVLIEGDGEKVSADSPFYVHYTGLTWAEREIFDSSWGGQAAQFSLDSLVPGVAEALEGQTVGSQVMVVVPPELGYGDESRPGIVPGSTLVFVFDILAIDATPVARQ